LSGGTAKDYADSVLLTIEPEFKNQVEEEVKKGNERREEARRERERRETIAGEIFMRLETPSGIPVNGNVFLEELMKTGSFTPEQAKEALRMMLSGGEIYEARQGYYQRTRKRFA
jgi:DNA replicative helicase MCM subunit Mcm2 (Cdc46/Mcm family)